MTDGGEVAGLEPAHRNRLAAALARDHGVPAEALDPWHLLTPADGSAVHATRVDPDDAPAPVVRAGVRLGAWDGDGFRLSIEGADLLEDHLDTVVDVGTGAARTWLEGDDVDARAWTGGEGGTAPGGEPRYRVLRWRGRILGSGPVRDGVVENHLPRDRRVADPRWDDADPGGGEPGSGPA